MRMHHLPIQNMAGILINDNIDTPVGTKRWRLEEEKLVPLSLHVLKRNTKPEAYPIRCHNSSLQKSKFTDGLLTHRNALLPQLWCVKYHHQGVRAN